jgi:hypothetical protein
MGILVEFRKDRAEHFVDCLVNGKPIEHATDEPGWTVREMMQLAGACFYALAQYGPGLKFSGARTEKPDDANRLTERDFEPPADREHLEAWAESLFSDLHAAVEVVADLTSRTKSGKYDEDFEGSVLFRTSQTVDGKVNRDIGFIEGAKWLVE